MEKILVTDRAKIYWTKGIDSKRNPGKTYNALTLEVDDSGKYSILELELGKASRRCNLSEEEFVAKYLLKNIKK